MDTTPKGILENNFNTGNGDAVNIEGHLESVLKIVSEICSTPLSLVNIKVGTEQETLAEYGKWDEDGISHAKSISRKLGGEYDFLVINDIREHKEIASSLSKEELETVKFFASVSLKDELGVTLGSMWVFDSEPRTFSESQKEYFKTLADEIEFRLQNYNQKELFTEKNRMIEKQSIFLKNSSDITFILQPETGKIIDVNNDIDQVLGYSPDSILDTNFVDLVAEYDLEPIELNTNQAITCSLIINEVVTNILKHAFDSGEAGILSVKLISTNGKVILTLADNGKGLPDDFDPARKRDSLGLELVDALASQLDAEYSYKSLDKGAQFTLTFEREESFLL